MYAESRLKGERLSDWRLRQEVEKQANEKQIANEKKARDQRKSAEQHRLRLKAAEQAKLVKVAALVAEAEEHYRKRWFISAGSSVDAALKLDLDAFKNSDIRAELIELPARLIVQKRLEIGTAYEIERLKTEEAERLRQELLENARRRIKIESPSEMTLPDKRVKRSGAISIIVVVLSGAMLAFVVKFFLA